MLTKTGLAISLPARELGDFRPSGSVFSPQELEWVALCPVLRSAVHVLTTACRRLRAPIVCIARPEIFTHGESLQWLMGRLKGIRDHVCLTDGTTVRPIHGLRNHVFLYRPSAAEHVAALRRLAKIAPELLPSLQSQINTAFDWRVGGEGPNPPSVLLQARQNEIPNDGLQLLMGSVPEYSKTMRTCQDLLLVQAPASALAATSFVRLLARRLREGARAQHSLALISLGSAASRDELIAALLRIDRRLEPRLRKALRACDGAQVNRLMALHACRKRLLTHSYMEHWRSAAAAYAAFEQIEIVAPIDTPWERKAWQGLLGRMIGAPHKVTWQRRTIADERSEKKRSPARGRGPTRAGA